MPAQVSPRDRPLYAVLIDAENIPAKFAEDILKEVTSFGEPALRRVYGDWSLPKMTGWGDKILNLGLMAHQETAYTKGKNASDIGLVIDAMDILHSGRFDGFVLVSSDSDFTRLASRIREAGLDVIGIGEAKTPISLKNVCNRFVTLENIIDEPAEPATGVETKSPKKPPPSKAVPLIKRAIAKIEQDDEWYSLSQLGHVILADNPDFDTRTYGKSKLWDLLENLNVFETRKVGTAAQVRLKPK